MEGKAGKKPRVNQKVTKPWQPALGADDWQVSEVEVRTRSFLAKSIVIYAAAAVTVAGIYSLYSGNYVPIGVVWGVAGPIVSPIIAHYFRKDLK